MCNYEIENMNILARGWIMEGKTQQQRRQHPLTLATDTQGQSCKNIVLLSSQASADRRANSMWHLLVMQEKKQPRNAHRQ